MFAAWASFVSVSLVVSVQGYLSYLIDSLVVVLLPFEGVLLICSGPYRASSFGNLLIIFRSDNITVEGLQNL